VRDDVSATDEREAEDMGAVHRTVRRTSRYGWLLVGLGVGYVLGTRAGRERYDQMTSWLSRTSSDLGVDRAMDRVVDSARDTAMDLRDSTAERARSAVDTGSQSLADGIQTAGSRAQDQL
jgi:hypothetical protein